MKRALIRLILLVLAALPACGGGTKKKPSYPPPPADAVETDGSTDGAPVGQPPRCTIQKPQENRILTGSVEVQVTVSDPEGEPVTRVVLAFLVPGGSPVKLADLKDPSEPTIAMSVDSKQAPDGPKSFYCQVETADGRRGTASVSVLVDNTPPVIELDTKPPTTQPGSNFLSDLVITLKVRDAPGVGANHVVVRVNGDAVADLVKPKDGIQAPIVVPTHELQKGRNTVEVTADDLAGNKMPVPFSYVVNFVPPPSFLAGKTLDLPANLSVDAIAGVRTAQGGALLATGIGATLLRPDANGNLNVATTLATSPVFASAVEDLDGDGLDDIIVAVSKTAELAVFGVFLQSASGAFSSTPSWRAEFQGRILAVTAGDLNRDGILDIVAATEAAGAPVAVALSQPSGGWGAFATYGGVPAPTLVAVGDFTADGDNDVLVGRKGSQTVTVFPANGANGTLLAGINSDLKFVRTTGGTIQATPLTNLSAMVAGPPVAGGKGTTAIVADSVLNAMYLVTPDPGAGVGALLVTTPLPAGRTPMKVLRADADADGVEDLVAFCPGSAMVLIEWGAAAAEFTEGPAFLAGQGSGDLAVAYLTGASHPDLILLDKVNHRLTLLRANPTVPRGFIGAPLVRLGFPPIAIAAGRYAKPLASMPNHKDLALLGEPPGASAQVQVLVSSDDTGLPTQKAVLVDAAVRTAQDLVTADLDQNGYDDLLIPTQMTSPSGQKDLTLGRLLFTQGASHIAPAIIGAKGIWAGDAPSLVAVADFKREPAKPGVLDLVVVAKFTTVSGQPPTLLFQPFVGQGDGTFQILEGVLYPVEDGLKPSSLAAARLTGGSNYDVVMTDSATGEVTLFFGKGLGLFKASEGEAKTYAVGPHPKRVAIEALGGALGSGEDPFPDLAVLLDSDVALVYAVEKSGDEVRYAPPVGLGHTGNSPVDLAIRDINGDSYPDLVVLDQADAMVSIYLNLAQGRFSDPFRYSVGLSPVRLVVADLDADSCVDIATADGTGETVTILRSLLCQQP